MGLRTKVLLASTIQLVLVGVILLALYYYGQRSAMLEGIIVNARADLMSAESSREGVSELWGKGIIDQKHMREWAVQGDIDKVLTSVPVISAMKVAGVKAEESGYAFRVPKLQARNAKNTPDAFETKVLEKLKDGNLEEYYEIDHQLNAFRYFRPIRLTSECLLCHGDPSNSKALWGNDQGFDATGAKMEGWKEGEIHGAFEIVQPLDESQAALMGTLWQGAGVVLALILVSAGALSFIINRSVINPVTRVIDELNDGSTQVSEAAAQVAQSGQRLAANANEGASSLQQTNASLQQLTAMVERNAENARNANDLVIRAKNSASDGSQTVEQLNGAMTGLNTATAEISNIIKAIEEIAFQTNLLALNAAVEAARAGESGRGFAVVADEVRSLAQRSAQAATETNALIANAVERTKQGTDVATQAATVLGSIIEDVGNVAGLVSDISIASEEQAQGISLITQSMSQLDDLTQQNAATAQESASAAQELSAQSVTMTGVVDNLSDLVTARGKSRYDSSSTSSADPWTGYTDNVDFG